MIFSDKKSFGIVEPQFLNNKYIAYSTFGSVKTPIGITPSDATAIDSCKSLALLKAYNEHLERRKMGFQTMQEQEIKSFNYVSKEISNNKKSYFGYGFNHIYGRIDTTGTASGIYLEDLVQKAILEIIEKNEMFLFWYLKKGFVIKKDYYITNKIKQYNFSSDRVEIYKCCELSNFITFIVILIADNKIIASGAGINGDSNYALEKALSEARLIEWQNKNNPMSNINNLTVEKNIEVINYINYLNEYLPNINFSSSSQKSLKIPSWISSFDIAVLNSMYDLESLTIKCISKDLFNWLPIKNNILLSLDKKIMQYYNVHISIINKTPDCILL